MIVAFQIGFVIGMLVGAWWTHVRFERAYEMGRAKGATDATVEHDGE